MAARATRGGLLLPGITKTRAAGISALFIFDEPCGMLLCLRLLGLDSATPFHDILLLQPPFSTPSLHYSAPLYRRPRKPGTEGVKTGGTLLRALHARTFLRR